MSTIKTARKPEIPHKSRKIEKTSKNLIAFLFSITVCRPGENCRFQPDAPILPWKKEVVNQTVLGSAFLLQILTFQRVDGIILFDFVHGVKHGGKHYKKYAAYGDCHGAPRNLERAYHNRGGNLPDPIGNKEG